MSYLFVFLSLLSHICTNKKTPVSKFLYLMAFHMNVDKKVLSYGDSLLRCSDVNLLKNGQWLNDKVIGFVFE